MIRTAQPELYAGDHTEDPIPLQLEPLVDWLDRNYPEQSLRSSEPAAIDASLKRTGVRELINDLRGHIVHLNSGD